MTEKNVARYHLLKALQGAVAEAEGNEALSRRLRAEAKLRLIGMSDEELWELAKWTSHPQGRPVDVVYQDHKRTIDELKATAAEWMNDLSQTDVQQGGEG